MKKAEEASKAVAFALMLAILSAVIVLAAEFAVCLDTGSSVDCVGGVGLSVLFGIPTLVFIAALAAGFRSLDIEISIKRRK